MKKLILLFSLCLSLFLSCQTATVGYAQQPDKWVLLEDSQDYQFYFDRESVYQNQEGVVSCWLKYVPLSAEMLAAYQPALIDYVEAQGGDSSLVTDKMYCIYQVEIDFEWSVYALDQHYWYNENGSFITSYKSYYDTQYFDEESEMGKNFLYIKENII